MPGASPAFTCICIPKISGGALSRPETQITCRVYFELEE
jgi:hypothetical protein